MNKKIILVIGFILYFFFIIIYNLKAIVDLALIKEINMDKALSYRSLQRINHLLQDVLLYDNQKKTYNDYLDLYMTATRSNTIFGHFSEPGPSYKIVFEIEFNDGSKKKLLPEVGCVETGLELNNLYREIATTNNELYREVLLKRIAEYECRNISNVKKIVAVVGEIDIPSPADFISGKRFYFKDIYKYNFVSKQ
jgi:hypothetical protein